DQHPVAGALAQREWTYELGASGAGGGLEYAIGESARDGQAVVTTGPVVDDDDFVHLVREGMQAMFNVCLLVIHDQASADRVHRACRYDRSGACHEVCCCAGSTARAYTAEYCRATACHVKQRSILARFACDICRRN